MTNIINDCWPRECPGLVRVGRDGDGGYVLPAAAFDEVDAVLSFGVSDDWSFEESCLLRRPGRPVHAYDPTVGLWTFFRRSLKRRFGSERRPGVFFSYLRFFSGNRRHFSEWVGGRPGQTGVLRAAERLGPSARLLVKMDIEGAEYGVLGELAALAPRLACLVIEFHDVPAHADEIAELVRRLAPTHPVVHLHGNNFAPLGPDGVTPTVIELTFARAGLLPADQPLFAGSLPRAGLDQPNNREWPDYVLARKP